MLILCAVSWIWTSKITACGCATAQILLTSYSAAQCRWLGSGCQGALDSGSCYSYILWSGSSTGLYHTTYKLAGGSLVYTQGTCSFEGRCLAGYAFAVRCLLLARYHATCGAGGHRVLTPIALGCGALCPGFETYRL